MNFSEWFDSIFSDYEPYETYYGQPESDIYKVCLVEPWTMQHLEIGFNASHVLNDLLINDAFSELNEFGYYYATLRGIGGGKSFALESIRRESLKVDGVMVIAITFNYLWSTYTDWPTKSPIIIIGLSIISRMISVFYGI